jgi:hypothetical protein
MAELAQAREVVLGEVHTACAFEAQAAGDAMGAAGHAAAAIRYDRSWLRNRGIWAVFVRSVLNVAFGRRRWD